MDCENNNTKPGKAALQNMVLLKKESSLFKVPKVPKKKLIKKAEVLDEEDYVEVIILCIIIQSIQNFQYSIQQFYCNEI